MKKQTTTRTKTQIKKSKLSKEQSAFLVVLEKSLGIVSVAAARHGIHRNTHYNWMKANATYKELAESITDVAIDLAESMLLQNIRSGEVASIIFYLKTKGKKRGYVEKSEIGLTDNEGNDVKKQVIVIGGKEIIF